MITYIIIIYFIGFFLCWGFCKHLRKKNDDNAWVDIFASLGFSSMSFAGIILILFIWIFYEIQEKIKSTKPPKWM